MRKKVFIDFFIRFIIITHFAFFINEAGGQNTIALTQKKSGTKQQSVPDTSIQKQKLFNELKKLNQTKGIYFFISDASLGDIMVMPVADENQPVEKILDELLKNTGLKFKKINEKSFVIVSQNGSQIGSQETVTAKLNAEAETTQPYKAPAEKEKSIVKLVKGKVTTAEGAPLANVSISAKGTTKGTASNAAGEFSLESVKGDVLEFSFVGYEKKEVIIEDDNPVTYLNTQLAIADLKMSEVIVTALGVTKNSKSVGYSVNTISSDQINASGNTNFASALYGKAPGLIISTAPGGATSAVQVQVRGLNSLNFNSQPLYVVDGIVIRNTNEKGTAGINNQGYWNDPRIRGNGILDINPSDIETLTILKGASATALYGSEAASGVVVITTKKGAPRQGIGIEVNFSSTLEQAAFLPKYQNVYGPGYDRSANLAEGDTEEGWIRVDTNGDGVYDNVRPNFNAYSQFGPKMEGQMVPWWDGKMRPYKPQPDNYKDLYHTGFNSIANAAFSNQTEKGAYRISYTRNDYNGIQAGSNMQRNTFNFGSSYKITKRLSTDIVANYINSRVHNRPFQLSRIIASYAGFFSRAEDIAVMFDKYKTSDGYKWVPWDQPQRNPAEALRYGMKGETLDFLWMQLRNSEDEDQDRLLSSFTLNYEINKNLKLRGRIGNDFTSLKTETKRYNEYPAAYNSGGSTGLYGIANGRYSILYSDALVTYARKIRKNFNFSVNAGYQSRQEKYNDQSSSTNGGLVKENWFSLINSYAPLTVTINRSAVLKYAFLGFFNLGYKNFVFLEGTVRQEYSSTLPPGRNSYFYPSANAGFVLSDAFKMPAFISYAKMRLSYGLVGNAPPAYASAITYTQAILPSANGPVASLSAQANAGNNQIRPENKYEGEMGMEVMTFKNRLGFDLTYYNSRITNQIIQLTVPVSTGAESKLVNAGELRSNGIELALTAIPIAGRNFKWNIHLNFAIGKTRVIKLANDVKQIVYYSGEQDAVRIVAEEGETVGNIYVYPHLTGADGKYEIGSNGLYLMDNSRYIKAGNVMPKITGGLANMFIIKNFSFDFMVDYRFGGKLLSPLSKYNLGAGMYESTLKYRDAAHGGLPYYINSNGEKVLLPDHNSAAPGDAKVYHDGMILKGVTVSGKENTAIVDAAYYYYNMFAWGPAALNQEGVVYNNSYIKMREAVLSYSLPEKMTGKMHCKYIKFSAIGRNLFYFWRTLKNLDPETPIGSTWTRQSIDEGTMAATRSYGFSLNLGF